MAGNPATLTNAGKGRPKGVPNKNTALLKDMILKALEGAGGVDYLIEQATENPGPFMTLVGKVLPLQIAGDPDGAPIRYEQVVEDADAFTRRITSIASRGGEEEAASVTIN